MGKKKSKATGPDPRLLPPTYEKGEHSKTISQDIINQLYEGAGAPYDKSIESLDPEALWDEMVNDPNQASDLQTMLQESLAALTLRAEQESAAHLQPRSQAGPSSSAADLAPAPTTSTMANSQPTEDTVMVQNADIRDVESAPEEVRWDPILLMGGKTVHLVRQYQQSTPVNQEDLAPGNDEEGDEDEADDDGEDVYDVEWVGALGLWEKKRGEGLMRLNLKWVGYNVSENTWEPFKNLGKEVSLPETEAEMMARCRQTAGQLGLEFVEDEDAPRKGKGKRPAAASSGKGRSGSKKKK